MPKYLKRFNVKPGLVLIVILYLLLALTYSAIVPIGRGADEWAHYWYAQFIASHGRLPVTPAEREAAGYKADWPPLYHLLAAAATGWIETAGPPTFKYRADNIRRQLVPAQGPEAILHTEDELFPWQQEILVWHLGRFLAIGFSVGTLLVTYFIALELFQSSKGGGEARRSFASSPPRPLRVALALASVAFLAFIPRFLFTGMLFSYDSLTLLLASLFLLLSIRVARGYYLRWGFWALGALAGLALLAKYLTALLPLEILLLAFMKPANGKLQMGNHHIPSFLRSFAPSLIPLGQATLAFLLVTGWWFGYLLVNFNEIDTYGPVLGTIAPLLRGDSSDRTVEQIFALMSGGQAPAPAHIETQSYTAWQIISEFPTTFWGNPITQPYPLNWFVAIMTAMALISGVGLAVGGRSTFARAWSPPRLVASLLVLHCLLPLPFMAIRLFGARDALEAVQGRHLLFLAGPAIVVLLVWGWACLIDYAAARSLPLRRIRAGAYYILFGLLLAGSLSQLIYMAQVYPSPLPVQTTPYAISSNGALSPSITLQGGARLIDYRVSSAAPFAPKVSLIWQAGPQPSPEDFLTELVLVDAQGQIRANWLAYQTQARYPTRAWEAGDTIRDEGWLPVESLDALRGDYEIRLRILNENGPVTAWQTLSTYTVRQDAAKVENNTPEWILWYHGKIASNSPTFRERETAQLTAAPAASPPQLIDPNGEAHPPTSANPTWANFIIGPNWPPGDYRLQPNGPVVLRVAENQRNFQISVISQPLPANFEGQVKLLGYHLPTRRVQPGEGLPVTLYWQGLAWMSEDFVIFNRLLDNQGIARGGYDRLAREDYSTLLWAPGEIITDGFAVPVDPAAPAGIYTLSLGWYRPVNGAAQSLAILNPESGAVTGATSVIIGPIKVGGPPPGVTATQVTPQVEVNVALGDQIKLLGFDLTHPLSSTGLPTSESGNGDAASASLPLHLTLYWQALAPPETDYTVFVHIRNAAGETVAQKDSPPAGGIYPTSLWDTGEVIKDEITIPLAQLEPGPYKLVIGMYNFTTGVRLPVAGSPDGAIVAQSFEVGE